MPPKQKHRPCAKTSRRVLYLARKKGSVTFINPASGHVRRSYLPDDGREYTAVVSEDFSLCSAGTNENPDRTFIEGPGYPPESTSSETGK